jgi:hypothetical protein
MKKCIKKKMLIKKIRVTFICTVVILVFQSTYAQRVEIPFTPRYTEQELKDLRKRIMNGDTVVYDTYALFVKPFHENLPYALFMANNYHYPAAYYDVYLFTLALYEDYKLAIDSISYSFAFQYLLKGAKLGSPSCNDRIAMIYYLGNRFVQQDTIKAKEFCTKEYNDDDTKEREWISFKRVYQRAFDAREEEY